MNGLSCPITLSQIPKVEKQNPSLSINVFGLDYIVFPLHITDKRDRNHDNHLLIANEDGEQHYCLIRNLSQLLGKRTHHNGQSYYCNYCLRAFIKQSLLNDHIPYSQPHGPQGIKVVNEQNKCLMFKKRMHQQRVSFVIYADFKCFTSKVDTCMPNPDTSYIHSSQIHEPSGFCYRVVCAHSKYSMDTVVYRGQNVVETFIYRIRECEIHITTILDNPVPMN